MSLPTHNWFSLRTKIILPYLFLALLLAIGAAVIGTRVAADSIQERFLNQLVEAGRLASEWSVREENRMLATERFLAHAEGLPEAIDARNAEKLRNLIYPITVNYQEEAVEILDVQGSTLLSIHRRPGGNLEDYEFLRGDDSFRTLALVQNVLQQQSDQVGDKYAARVRTQYDDCVYVAGPIMDGDGKLVGVAMVGKTLNTIARQIREATLAQVSIYEIDGTSLATTLLETPSVSPSVAAESLGHATQERSLIRDHSASDILYTEILAPWQARRDVTLGLIGVSFAKNFLVILSQNTWVQILISVLIAFVLVLVIGYVVSSLISRPIVRLEHAAAAVAEGDLCVQVTPTGNDEVAQLTRQFNEMISSLAHSKRDLIAAYDSTLEGWVRALDLRDRETTDHSQRVAHLTVELARRMNVPSTDLENIRRGALLHDIGKIAIPDGVLLKPGPLSDDEMQLMRRHPTFAMQMLQGIPFLARAAQIPGGHHEKWDGSGYPCGLKGEEIPLGARIFAVVDVWDSLRSDRPYRLAMSTKEAETIIRMGVGSHFDPQVAQAFLEMMSTQLA